MPKKQEIGQGSLFEGWASLERAENHLPRRDYLPPRPESVRAPAPEATEEASGVQWARLVGRIVSFSHPDIQTRCYGSVLKVAEAPDYKGLPTCLALVVGRTGKRITINYTECYGQTHDTWAEAERSQ